MKVTLISICRRKHRIQNSNLKSRSFRYGYLLLSLCLLLLVSAPVFAVDESGNVFSHSVSYDAQEIIYVNTSSNVSEWPTIYNFNDPNDFGFNKYAFSGFWSFSGITKFYNNFYNISSSGFSDYNYIVFELSYAAMSSNVLLENAILYCIDSNNNYFTLDDIGNFDSVSLEINGVSLSGVQCYYIVEISDFSFFTSSFTVQARSDIRFFSGGSGNFPLVTTPLTIKFYKNYQDVIADVNSNVQQIINQNDVIINNLNEVKGQLNNIHNSLSSDKNPDNPELDSELSDANQIEQDFKDKFQDFVDIDKIDRVENIITDWTNNTKILSSFIFVRNVLDLLFDEVPVLSILFSVGSACIILTMLFGIVSHSFRSPSGNVAQDPRSYTYNYIMFSNLSQQHTLSSKKADFHAFDKSDGSWGV